jgi:hypothetical protein
VRHRGCNLDLDLTKGKFLASYYVHIDFRTTSGDLVWFDVLVEAPDLQTAVSQAEERAGSVARSIGKSAQAASGKAGRAHAGFVPGNNRYGGWETDVGTEDCRAKARELSEKVRTANDPTNRAHLLVSAAQ